jgi:hypothetical protein
MQERSLYHSKTPGKSFSKDAAPLIPACLNKAMALYDRLEEKRKSQ